MSIHTPKKEPDITKCRTSKVGAVIPIVDREMYYCGLDNAECRYAMQLGWDYICRHHDNAAFSVDEALKDNLIESNSDNDLPA